MVIIFFETLVWYVFCTNKEQQESLIEVGFSLIRSCIGHFYFLIYFTPNKLLDFDPV